MNVIQVIQLIHGYYGSNFLKSLKSNNSHASWETLFKSLLKVYYNFVVQDIYFLRNVSEKMQNKFNCKIEAKADNISKYLQTLT